jgi:hypothetical protein
MIRAWTKEEKDYLANNLDLSNKQLAQRLNRTAMSISSKIGELKLKRNYEQKMGFYEDQLERIQEVKHSGKPRPEPLEVIPDDFEKLALELYKKHSARDVAAMMGCSPGKIGFIAEKHGFHKKPVQQVSCPVSARISRMFNKNYLLDTFQVRITGFEIRGEEVAIQTTMKEVVYPVKKLAVMLLQDFLPISR